MFEGTSSYTKPPKEAQVEKNFSSLSAQVEKRAQLSWSTEPLCNKGEGKEEL